MERGTTWGSPEQWGLWRLVLGGAVRIMPVRREISLFIEKRDVLMTGHCL